VVDSRQDELEAATNLSAQLPAFNYSLAIAPQADSSLTGSSTGSLVLADDWLKKPEAVVLVAFAFLVIIWQAYLDLSEAAGSEEFLSGKKLAERLGVSYSTVNRRKYQEDFGTWSRKLDPDSISWAYNKGRFLPVYQLDLVSDAE
jgi:hypothetical protein